jgi:hypothetical protein
LTDLFNNVIESPGENIPDDLLYFNVPVCDLDGLGELDYHNCKEAGSTDKYVKDCVLLIIALNCKKLKLGDSEWPYVYDV